MLACEQGLLGQRRVRLRRSGDHDRLDGVVGEHLVEVGDRMGVRVPATERAQRARLAIADGVQAKLGRLGQVTGEVGTPVAAADHRSADRRGFAPRASGEPRADIRGGPIPVPAVAGDDAHTVEDL